MTCDGYTCTRYKAKKPVGIGRYESGQSRCQTCEIFINFNGLKCPCCNTRLRKVPRNIVFKQKLRENGRTEYGVAMN